MKKNLSRWILAAGMALCMAATAWGAEQRIPLTSYALTVNSTITPGESGGEVTVTGDENGYQVGEVEIQNEPMNTWSNGTKPKIKVTLYANDEYYFRDRSRGNFSFSGDSVTFNSTSLQDDKSTMSVYLTLAALSGGDLTVSGLYWDTDSGTAYWSDNGAKRYQVRLFRGSTTVTTVTTTDTEYCLGKHFTQAGTYGFSVRAADYNSNYGSWSSSDSFYVTSQEAYYIRVNAPSNPSGGNTPTGGNTPGSAINNGSSNGPLSNATQAGGWCKDNVGWWYRHTNGSYTVNNWEKINNYWYFFNQSGYMYTGWLCWNNLWYYMDANTGAMLSNCTTPDGHYVNADGVRMN